ncbi:MAG: heavy metal-binding domain-containing protein [Myxococcaceae bacterium]
MGGRGHEPVVCLGDWKRSAPSTDLAVRLRSTHWSCGGVSMARSLAVLVSVAVLLSACTSALQPLPISVDPSNPEGPEAAPAPVTSALRKRQDPEPAQAVPSPEGRQAVYSCPMHPEVMQSEPGRCPRCGMRLEIRPPTSGGEMDVPDAGNGHGHHKPSSGGDHP